VIYKKSKFENGNIIFSRSDNLQRICSNKIRHHIYNVKTYMKKYKAYLYKNDSYTVSRALNSPLLLFLKIYFSVQHYCVPAQSFLYNWSFLLVLLFIHFWNYCIPMSNQYISTAEILHLRISKIVKIIGKNIINYFKTS